MDEYSIALGEYNRPKALPRPKRLPRPKGLPSNPASAVCTLGAYPDRRGLSSARALPCDVDLGRRLRTKNSIALGGFSPWVKCRSPEGTASPKGTTTTEDTAFDTDVCRCIVVCTVLNLTARVSAMQCYFRATTLILADGREISRVSPWVSTVSPWVKCSIVGRYCFARRDCLARGHRNGMYAWVSTQPQESKQCGPGFPHEI